MEKKLLIIFCCFICSLNIHAESKKRYQGIAKIESRIVYTENHTVSYDAQGKLLKAKTEYLSNENKLIATLNSDFTRSLSVPEYEMVYTISGNREGLRWVNNEIIIFDHIAGKEEKSKMIDEKTSKDKILMAGQGFNYYLIENLATIKEKKILPIRLLIPGKLDYYDFRVKFISEDSSGNMEFELSVDSWILRLIAPTLYVRFNKNEKRIVWYNGLSNIPDEKGKPQTVLINYLTL